MKRIIREKWGVKGVCLLVLLCTMFACKSSMRAPFPYKDIETAPVQTVYNSKSTFTDGGKIQMKMESPLMYNYSDEKGSQVFPKGAHSMFFGENGRQTIDLVSDSAINIQSEELMKFYGNVVVKDYRKGETLYTQALYWDQKNRKIYSDVAVRKVSSNMILEGDGFDSDEEMNDVRLRRPRGVIL